MSKKTTPICFGDMRDGNTYAERCCNDCGYQPGCRSITASGRRGIPLEHVEEKKGLDKEWVELTIDMLIGPSLIILGMKTPKDAVELRKILVDAIFGLHKDWTGEANTNEWVVAVSDRLHELYNTYITARLIHFFDNGVPKDSKIVTPGRSLRKMN